MVKNFRCISQYYPRDNSIKRFPVIDKYLNWTIDYPDYKPVIFTTEKVLTNKRADPDILKDMKHKLKFNDIDGKIDRKSFEGTYLISSEGLPLNPKGRTGIKGRGCLYYWGPNHAADPVVTTWKLDNNGEKVLNSTTNKPILKFVAIFRKQDKEWALPGGMVDPGEAVTETVKREFSEEALNSTMMSDEEKKKIHLKIEQLLADGTIIFKGYVDDPRNTDNAWMETVAVNFHDECSDSLAKIDLQAGDDASAVKWIEMSSNLQLYASHSSILKQVALKHQAHW